MEPFDQWWGREGQSFDPDTCDVSWFDKRKALAEKAFHSGQAQAMSYVADDAIYPQRITFAGGREVIMKGAGHLFVRTKP